MILPYPSALPSQSIPGNVAKAKERTFDSEDTHAPSRVKALSAPSHAKAPLSLPFPLSSSLPGGSNTFVPSPSGVGTRSNKPIDRERHNSQSSLFLSAILEEARIPKEESKSTFSQAVTADATDDNDVKRALSILGRMDRNQKEEEMPMDGIDSAFEVGGTERVEEGRVESHHLDLERQNCFASTPGATMDVHTARPEQCSKVSTDRMLDYKSQISGDRGKNTWRDFMIVGGKK